MAILTALASFAAVVAAKVSADEINAWLPWLVRRLVAFAVRLLPEDQRERYSEEWSSHVIEVPGRIGKIVAAAGLVLASLRINLQLSGQEGIEAGDHEPYEPGRSNFGPLPEPARSPGAFITSLLFNVTILVIILFSDALANRHFPFPLR
jgi:hypothetical protein